jgi:hypothetical protein
VRAIGSSWRTEGGRLICRWPEAKQMQVPYNPPWMQDVSKSSPHNESVSPLVLELDFNRLSVFAGRGWFERSLGGFTSRPVASRNRASTSA